MLAAVLWLGNVSFGAVDNETYVEPVADEGDIQISYSYTPLPVQLFLTFTILFYEL